MLEYISNFLDKYGVNPNASESLSNLLLFLLLILIMVLTKYVINRFILHLIKPYKNKPKFKWLSILEKKKFFDRASHIVPIIILNYCIPTFSLKYQPILKAVAYIYLVVIITCIIDSILDSITRAYDVLLVNKNKPIKGFIQVLDIIVYVTGGIFVVSKLIGKSPAIILSSLGALAAIFSIIFKDTLLGFVASIQISANNIIKIGDFIEIPEIKVAGTVLDISLTAIKIENMDKTITTIQPYSIISSTVKNWRNVDKVDARLIQSTIYIDISSIGFCSASMLERFKKIDYLSDYIIKKQIDIEQKNKLSKENPEMLIKKHITNIEIFREYIKNYLKNNIRINSDMMILVRQLDIKQNGVPLEIFAYTNTGNWKAYEVIRADIFDHIISIAPEFGIKLFQSPSGNDLKKLDV